MVLKRNSFLQGILPRYVYFLEFKRILAPLDEATKFIFHIYIGERVITTFNCRILEIFFMLSNVILRNVGKTVCTLDF